MDGTGCTSCGRFIPASEPARILNAVPVCRECADEQDPRCPYCDELLDKLPKRAKKCPHCEKRMLVRTKQTVFATSLLTENEALEIDWLPRLETHGIDYNTYRRIKSELKSRGQGFGSADFVWAAFNQAFGADAIQLAFDMARFLFETGRDPNQQLAIVAKARFSDWGNAGVETVTINSKDCCVSCRRLHGKQLTLSEAQSDTSIPQTCCTRESSDGGPAWCVCSYSPDWD